jgi:hypothetical protein
MNKTLFLSQPTDLDDADLPQPEARMREALGLRSNGTRIPPSQNNRPERAMDHGVGTPRRHRFVQEGEVPVEVMSLREHAGRGATPAPGFRQRGGEDSAALATERSAREQAERALAEATDRVRELQTKLGHAELARDEALALAMQRQTQIETFQTELRDAAAREAALEAAREAARAQPAPPVVRKAAAPKPPVAAKPAAAPRPRGRKPAPKPVKWWIKSTP